MSRNNTGNPIDSKAFPDFEDNVKNLDQAVNAEQDTFQDRLGKSRLTWAGMENQFDADQGEREVQFESDQTSRDNRFNDFIASSGYQFVGDYAPGIEVTEYNQLVRDSNGEFWRVSGQVDLPYVTTGAGIPEDDALVPAGDAVLRQELASSPFDLYARRVSEGATTGATPVSDAPNIINGHSSNFVADDVHSCVIGGGGAANRENVIGGDITKVDSDQPNYFANPEDARGTNSRYSAILAGYDNVCNGLATVMTGMHCYSTVNQDHGAISGGSFHRLIEGAYGYIGGGTGNWIATSACGTIAGGRNNRISNTGNDAGVTISGGEDNSATNSFSTVSGGRTNSASGLHAAVGGGSACSTSQNNSVIGGGNGNTISGSGQGGVISGGMFNTVTGESAWVPGGRSNSALHTYSSASGYFAKTERSGQKVWAMGRKNVDGDRQIAEDLLKIQTTNATPAILRYQDNATDVILKASTVFYYRIIVIAHRVDVTTENQTFILEGMMHRADSGLYTQNKVDDVVLGVQPWSVSFIDNGFGSLRVVGTGEEGKTIDWVAYMQKFEVFGT